MKTYSVWNHGHRRYDYYATPDVDHATATGRPNHLRQTNPLGISPEDAAWPLPAHAKLAGHGDRAVGHIAAPRGSRSVALSGLPTSAARWAGMAVVAVIVWKTLT